MKKVILIVLILVIVIAGFFVIKNNKKDRFEYEIENISNYNYYIYEEQEKYGVIDKKGNIIVQAQYADVIIPNPEKDVFICYEENENESENTKIINSSGKEIFNEYELVKEIKLKNVASDLTYEKSVLIYKKDNLYGLINFDGKVVTKPIYDSIENLRPTEGKFIVSKNGKYGVIDLKGNTLVETEYDKVESDEYYTKEDGYKKSGFIVANKETDGYKYGYISFNCKKILDTKYNQIARIEKGGDEIYLITYENGQCGVSKNEKEIIPNSYQDISYDEKLDILIVQKSKQYGIASLDGKFLTDIKYNEIEPKGIYIYAQKDGKTEIYDTKGKIVNMDPNRSIYETENSNYKISTILNNYVTYYGIVDNNGNTLVEEKYRYIEYAYKNYFIATNEDGNLGIIDDKGNTVLDMNYKSLQKIKGKEIIQGVNSQTNIAELYNNQIQKTAEISEPKIQIQLDYIVISNDNEEIFLDNMGNIITDTSNLPDMILPETIGEYTKVQTSIDNVYYSKKT